MNQVLLLQNTVYQTTSQLTLSWCFPLGGLEMPKLIYHPLTC